MSKISVIKSNMHMLNKGVPQGSIFSPLLFLICINDFVYVSSKLHFTFFANDNTVLFMDHFLKTSFNVASNKLKIVFDCFFANKLYLNVKKTHFLLFVLVYVVMT